ncbi:Histone-lysine N-methyltransferase SETMAR [Eufriesea mexicana]|uniref:Histone-lysine N-methyltransferase SETMAR n=1 Tax=Eufriesea mexicana TaxID=516756 RepID=A0A310SM48_9HYME|nr:Histone-lysine N-methyltransferase SETMAR [Eufriesea mexicana]
MESEKQHVRHILLFYYRKGKNAVQAKKKLSDIYSDDVLTERQCQNWFAKFRFGNFDVEDAPRSGRPVEADCISSIDTIKALIDANQRITTREIAERLNLSNSTVHDLLKRLGLISNLDIWVPRVLIERNLCRRVDACDLLLKSQKNDPFLKRIVTIALLLVASTSTVYSKPAPEPPVNSYFPPPSGPSHSGVSGNYGPPIPDRYGPPQQQPVVHKHVYVHVPPPEAPEYSPPKYIPPASPPQKHYKIVFIKAPTPPTPTAPALPPLPPQDEEKTLIYVLVKKPEEAPDVVLPTQAPTQPSKPEVYFIRYKTQSTEYGPPHQSPPSDNYGSPPSNPGGPY